MIVKSKPIVKTFSLTTDESGEAKVTIRQATFAEDMERADAYTIRRTILAINETERPVLEENGNRARIIAKEIKSVLSGASGFSDEKGADLQLFSFKEHRNGLMKVDMTEQQFMEALGQLESEAVEEIHDYVLEMNPTWGTPREKKKKIAEEGKQDDPMGESAATSEK